MNDDDIVLDELFEAARELQAPAGAEARGWDRFEAVLGGTGPILPAEATATKLAWLAPTAKLGGVVVAALALGVALSRPSDPPHAAPAAKTTRTTDHTKGPAIASPRVLSPAVTPEAAPASSPSPAPSPPSPFPEGSARRGPSAAPRSVASRTAAKPEPVAPTDPAPGPAPEPEVVIVQRPTAVPASPTTATTDSLRLEAELLGRAWVAIREGQGDETRALLAEHARRFPRGALAPEREACQLVARCSAGETDAIDRARRYLDQHRASHLAARVADGCGLARP